MNKLDTSNPYNYNYASKALEIHSLGGIKTNKLDTLRVTLSIAKAMLFISLEQQHLELQAIYQVQTKNRQLQLI